METKSFVKLLRKVIREEVSTALRNILAEQKVDHNKVMSHGMDLHKIVEHPSPYSTKKKKTYTKDNMLNDLLNETAATGDFASMMQGPAVSYEDDYPQMGPARTSTMVRPNQPMTGINGERVDTSKPEMAAVQKALTRDYSALVKSDAFNKRIRK